MRHDGRNADELRALHITPNFVRGALGSVLIECGKTRVICTASVEGRAPSWLDQGGWVTAEYVMMPASTRPRKIRKTGGREKEIQRLIGRSLRASVDLSALVRPDGSPISIVCDCDVLEADGGTRTASVTGAYAALEIALRRMVVAGDLTGVPVVAPVAAVSVGLVKIQDQTHPVLDLDYVEDSQAIVDMNVVRRSATADEPAAYVELQGTGEGGVFVRDSLQGMLDLADAGIDGLLRRQAEAIAQGVQG